MNTTLSTGKIRAGYVHIAEPRMNDLNSKMEYSMQLIIPKDSQTAKDIKNMVETITAKRWGANRPDDVRQPLRDDEKEQLAKGQKPQQHLLGMYFMNVRTGDAPGIVGPDGRDIVNPAEPRSGDFFRVSMGGFAYDKPTNGVSFGLNNVQFICKGETLSGRKRAEDDFQAFEETQDGMLE